MSDAVQWILPTPLHLLALIAALLFFTRRRRLLWWLLLGWAWILTTPAIANLLTVALEGPVSDLPRVARDERTQVLVLASGELYTPDGQVRATLSRAGWSRASAGVALWRQTGGTLVFSGGPDGSGEASIAAAMAKVARDMGVPDGAIRLSPRGGNTYDELRGARDVLVDAGAPRWLVTSASHMPRAARAAACLGLGLRPASTDFRQIVNVTWRSWLPDTESVDVYTQMLHEVAGMALYRVRHGCGASGSGSAAATVSSLASVAAKV